MDPAACESWLNCDRERYCPVDMGNSNIRPKRLHCFWRILHASAAYHGAITTFVHRPIAGECHRYRYYGKIRMRGCTCIAGNLQWCPWCAQLAARAGITLGAPTPSHNAIGVKAAPRTRGIIAPQHGMPGRPEVTKTDRFRSDTERKYAALLEQWQREGEVRQWYYEPIRLYLAPKTTLTVDFLVIWDIRPRDLELHEVKPKWYREDGWQKLKIAAALYPCFRFLLAQWKDRKWTWQTIPAL